jgi:predicted metalloendopeptidase
VIEYDKRVECVAEEFGSPHVVGDLTSHCPNVAVSDYGRLTITEDTADVLGVTAAYRAMTALGNDARQGKPSHALTPRLTPSSAVRMRFFYSFSQMWCSVANAKYECAKAMSDVHAVPRVRVDSTLRNLKEFQDTFACPNGKYMKKDARCEVF